jgi:hypothetical protein
MDENPYQAPIEGGDSQRFSPGPIRPFTLGELLLCVAIIGILTALLLPARQSSRNRPRQSPPAVRMGIAPEAQSEAEIGPAIGQPAAAETVSPPPAIR